jgi:hypothetical protein
MMTKRELFSHYNLKCTRPAHSQAKLTQADIKAVMRFTHSNLINEMQHIPMDSELGMELARKIAYYQEIYREWWNEKCQKLAEKEAKAKPTNPETMNYIHK